jgi:exopolysaccharide biosynthesis predicted pyruvyltransferase EpsI
VITVGRLFPETANMKGSNLYSSLVSYIQLEIENKILDFIKFNEENKLLTTRIHFNIFSNLLGFTFFFINSPETNCNRNYSAILATQIICRVARMAE